MKLVTFNGSPRGKHSNSQVFIDKFADGFKQAGGEVSENHYLVQIAKVESFAKDFECADAAFLVFPLYTDAMPGIVKNFIETVGDYDGKQKPVVFMVHSGFEGGIHCSFVARYLKLLADRWNLKLAGIIIKPGSEGTRLKPESWNKSINKYMADFGAGFFTKRELDPEALQKFKGNENLSNTRLKAYKLMDKMGLTNMYWNTNLKKHKAFKKRFDAPFK